MRMRRPRVFLPYGKLSSVPIRILADDLSGAADCAASFTGAAGPMSLLLRGDGRGEVQFALDADTRATDAASAARRWKALGEASSADRRSLLFKKIDSTLRGHIAPELCALLDGMPHVSMVVVAPAFPEQGRTYVNGRLYVHGEATNVSLAAIGEVIRAAADHPRALVLGDATEQADLAGLVEGMGGPDAGTLWVGSSGLARALAGAPPTKIDAADLAAPMLIVVGSFSPVARAQVEAFARERGESVATPSTAAGVMRTTGLALVHLPFDEAPTEGSRDKALALAASLREAARRCGTLVATGGDTARAMLEALGVEEIFIEGELEPGLAVSAPVEPHGFRAVLKAGGFGDNDTLLRIAAAVSPSR
jgi:uncharacterized protein YgbK (DUF1537 family)